jgi:DNA-binding HxlR family transcriptional regulator
MHERLSHDTSNCSIARTLEIVGEKWTLLILRETLYGVTRFADFLNVLDCPRNLLAERLRMLVERGILAVKPYKEPGERARNHYVLTDKGGRLMPVIIGLLDWGDKYLADPAGPAVHVVHRECKHHVRLEMICDDGHRIQSASDLKLTPGPAFRLAANAQRVVRARGSRVGRARARRRESR